MAIDKTVTKIQLFKHMQVEIRGAVHDVEHDVRFDKRV